MWPAGNCCPTARSAPCTVGELKQQLLAGPTVGEHPLDPVHLSRHPPQAPT